MIVGCEIMKGITNSETGPVKNYSKSQVKRIVNEKVRTATEKLNKDLDILKREKKELEERSNILERRIKQEADKTKEYRKILTEVLPEYYLNLQEKLHNIKNCRQYEKFFDENIFCFQNLIGIAREKDLLSKEQQNYYVWDVIRDPLLNSVKKMRGEIKDGKLLLPGEDEEFDRNGMKEYIKEENLMEIARYIREDKITEDQAAIAFQKRGVVQKLGDIITGLEEMSEETADIWEMINRLEQKAEMVLEENGIYPMFADDDRLEEYPELRRRFSPLNRYSIRYPGIYIRRADGWEVLGSHIGMGGPEE